MARKPRTGSPAGIYHFITRGVNKKKIFHKAKDCEFYLGLLKEYSQKLNVPIYHYCILSNHAHLVVQADDLQALGQFGHFTHRKYAYYYCKTYKWPEQVFRRNFRSIPIEDEAHLLECGRYVERNPLGAGLAKKPEEYLYSSYRFYAEGEESAFLSQSPAYLGLGNNDKDRKMVYQFYVTQERRRELES